MTPQEKAEELVDKFHIKVLDRDGTSAMNEFEAKQCALIAVNEILHALEYKPTHNYVELRFYEEVKQEIEKL